MRNAVRALPANPTVSVIIPTYGRDERFLRRAIDSVRAQTYRPIEPVVVDDNPADSAYRPKVEALMASYPDVVYVQNERNLGGSGARNAGIARATGELVTFLDDDDEYLPEKVARQVDALLADDLDLCFEDSYSYDTSGRLVHKRTFGFLQATDNETLLRAHLTHHLTPTNVYLFRKDKLLAIGGFQDAAMGQEFFLMLRAIEQGLKIGYLPRADVKQNLHMEGRISQGANKIRGEAALFEFKKTYFDRLPKADVRYIVFRHYVVMGVAYKRNGQPLRMLGSFLRAIAQAPGEACREGSVFIGNILRQK